MPDPHDRGTMDFRLSFRFGPNEFFPDALLTKDYEVRMPDASAPGFEGPEVVDCRGCKVRWNKGRNVTLRPVKKKQKVMRRTESETFTVLLDCFFVFSRTAKSCRSGPSATASLTSSPHPG